MNGKQISIGLLVLLLLGLGWLAIHHFGTGDPLPDPVGTDRGTAVAASGSHGTMPSEPSAEAQRTAPPVVDRDARALIFGSVVDAASGAPVAAATVTLFDFAMQAPHRTETDEHGHYAFPSTRGRVDAFRLAIDKLGAGRLGVPEVRAAIEARRDELQAGLVLHGRVRLATGAVPPPGCRVLALRLPFQLHDDRDTMAMLRRQALPPELCIDRETEAAAGDGTFLLSDLQAGRHVLLVLTAGRQPLVFTGKDTFDPYAGCEAAPANSAPALEIVLPAAGSVTIEVVDGDTATPIHDASVTTAAETTELWLPLVPIAVDPAAPHRFRVPVDLDERGRTRSFEILVTAPGRSPVHFGASGQQDGETFVVALGRPAIVLGTVRGDDGAPIQGAPILIRGNSDRRLAGHTRTDAHGAFEIGGLCAADSPMSLFCLQPDRSEMLATVPLRLVDGEVRRVDIGPGTAGTLSGRVTIAGQPQPNVHVDVYSRRSQVDLRSRTNDDGGFAFFALPADTYEVAVDSMVNGRRVAAKRSATIDTAPIHIDFEFNHRLTGRARFEGLAPGAPLAFFLVRQAHEAHAGHAQALQRVDAVVVGPADGAGGFGVVVVQPLEHVGHRQRRGTRRALGLDALEQPPHQLMCAATDQQRDLVERPRSHAELGQRAIDGGGDLGRRVDEGAVEVETEVGVVHGGPGGAGR